MTSSRPESVGRIPCWKVADPRNPGEEPDGSLKPNEFRMSLLDLSREIGRGPTPLRRREAAPELLLFGRRNFECRCEGSASPVQTPLRALQSNPMAPQAALDQ